MLDRSRTDIRLANGIDCDPPLLVIPIQGERIVLPRDCRLLQQLIRELAVCPRDLDPSNPAYSEFLRVLFLLATQECLQTPTDETLRNFVRAIR
jgi:hypothetical protein